MSVYHPDPDILASLNEWEIKKGAARLRETCKFYLLRKTVTDGGTKRRPIPKLWTTNAFGRQNGLCARCGKDMILRDAVGDHRIALALGGKHVKWNIVAMHRECNASKGANDLVKEAKKTGVGIVQQLQK